MRAVTSASNIHRRALCPGSERLEADLPDTDSAESREGTLLHEYDRTPKLERAVLKPYHRDLLRISAELDDYVFKTVEEGFEVGKEPFEDGWNRPLVALSGINSTPGTCDRFRFWPARKLLIIIDKKFGYKVVTPAGANLQLRVYALGGWVEWQAQDCVVAITQPRLPFGERVTLAQYDASDLDLSAEELRDIREASRKKDAPLIPGEEQCRYCKARGVCPELRKVIDSNLVPYSPEWTKERRIVEAEKALSLCSDDALDSVIKAITLAEFVKELAWDEARRRVADGKLTTYELGKGAEVRGINDVEKAIALLRLKGLSLKQIYEAASLSIGPLQDRLRDQKKLTHKAAKEALNETLESVLTISQNKPKLIRKK